MVSANIRCRGCFNITIENDSVTLNSGDRLFVRACVPAIVEIRYNLKHVA